MSKNNHNTWLIYATGLNTLKRNLTINLIKKVNQKKEKKWIEATTYIEEKTRNGI